MKKRIIPLMAILMLVLAGCSSNDENTANEAHNGKTSQSENRDIQEKTSGINQLPAFLNDKPDQMKTIYSASAKSAELLASIPCYCGCGESAGHKSNLNCFVADTKKDGSIIWDDHGTKCKVCLDIAAESIVRYNKGNSPAEIRAYIDETYKEGYAKPTPTPMPHA
ncbi:PCYCGC motif-containing (lipo)protein [Bacillus sp. 1P06AnD]|uniref:PCYCGC motif-containing (lipo)protein n=1 Tax=Bacillus sp. 1P06AnD TaxID=3132208 RepID=UPI0039A230FE